MRTVNLFSSLALVAILCGGCSHRNPSPPPQQAQAPPLQTGKGTLSPPKTTQPQEKSETPLASPLPPPSAQSVPLPPPPPPKKVRKKQVKQAPAKPADTAQTPAATTGGTAPPAAPSSPVTAQAAPPQQPAAANGTASPIGQLTTGDSATGEKAKHETEDLINETLQGVNAIKRPLSTEEQVTAAQIHAFLKQAQQALDNGDTDGGRGLATKAKQLLDELTKP
jgi:outer membrane biosynthesis protein TonB